MEDRRIFSVKIKLNPGGFHWQMTQEMIFLVLKNCYVALC